MDGDTGSEGCMSLKGDVKGGCNDRLEIGDDDSEGWDQLKCDGETGVVEMSVVLRMDGIAWLRMMRVVVEK
jgi:hypothetical protein